MEANRRITDIIDRMRAPLRKLGESVAPSNDEEDLIHAVIQRIDIEGEPLPSDAAQLGPVDAEEMYGRLLKRLQWQVRKSGLGPEELVRTYQGEVRTVLLHKSFERYRGGASDKLRGRFIDVGLKNVQPGVWILPPNKTPPLANHEEIRMWVRREFAKPFGKTFDYVFSFVAVVDLKKVIAEKRGIRKMPAARTIYNVLEVEEVVPPSHLYAAMKARKMGVRDIVLSGDIVFLTSAFAEDREHAAIKEHEAEIVEKLRRMTGSQSVALVDIANIGSTVVASAFEGCVLHPKDFAQRLTVEAQYWMRFLGGTVPG